MAVTGADDLVVANLTFDTSGMSAGAAELSTELQNAEQATTRFGGGLSTASGFSEQLEHRMFSLRFAAHALLGTFTLAGLILEFKALIDEAAKLDRAFARNKAGAEIFNQTLAEGIAHLPLLGDAIAHWGDVLLTFSAQLKTLADSHYWKLLWSEGKGAAEDYFLTVAAGMRAQRDLQMVRDFLGLPKPQEVAQTLASVQQAMGEITKTFEAGRSPVAFYASEVEKLLGMLDKIGKENGPAAIAALDKFGVALQDAFRLGRASAIEFIADQEKIIDRFSKMGEIGKATSQATIAMDEMTQGFQRGAVRGDQLWAAYERLRASLIKGGATNAAIAEFDNLNRHLLKVHDTVVALQEGMQLMARSLGDNISKAIFEGGVTMKQALAEMFRDLARLYIVKSLESLATGILASTPWGQMLGLGNPGPYYLAAEVYGALAGMAGAAALAVGGRGSLTGASSGAGAHHATVAPAAPPAQLRQGNTFVFEGTVVTESPAGFIRWFRAHERKMAGMNA